MTDKKETGDSKPPSTKKEFKIPESTTVDIPEAKTSVPPMPHSGGLEHGGNMVHGREGSRLQKAGSKSADRLQRRVDAVNAQVRGICKLKREPEREAYWRERGFYMEWSESSGYYWIKRKPTRSQRIEAREDPAVTWQEI